MRYNETCMELNLRVSLDSWSQWWHPEWLPGLAGTQETQRNGNGGTRRGMEAGGGKGGGDGPEEEDMVIHPTSFMTNGVYPYFTNTIWLTSTSLYTQALHSIHLVQDGFDEVTMNRSVLA